MTTDRATAAMPPCAAAVGDAGAAMRPRGDHPIGDVPAGRGYHPQMLTRLAALVFWRTLALVSVALGLIGVFLPGLPTVPFLLLAAWAGGKGWPQLEAWLLNHPRHGAAIRRWRDHRAVPRRAKWLATVTMASSSALLWWSSAPFHAKWGVPLFLVVVATWLWTRPEI